MLSALCTTGCMDPLKNYDECVEIETARCDLRHSCIGVGDFNDEFPDFDYDTCIAYAQEHCRTREIVGSDDCEDDLTACVDLCVLAIENVDCGILEMSVDETVHLPDCEFINGVEDEDAGTSDAG
jgi:hypothetical protein